MASSARSCSAKQRLDLLFVPSVSSHIPGQKYTLRSRSGRGVSRNHASAVRDVNITSFTSSRRHGHTRRASWKSFASSAAERRVKSESGLQGSTILTNASPCVAATCWMTSQCVPSSLNGQADTSRLRAPPRASAASHRLLSARSAARASSAVVGVGVKTTEGQKRASATAARQALLAQKARMRSSAPTRPRMFSCSSRPSVANDARSFPACSLPIRPVCSRLRSGVGD